MKRKLALFMLLCMIFGLFGCSQSGTQTTDPDKNDVEATDNEYPDLFEYEFNYLQTMAEPSMFFFGYHDGSLFADAARTRVKEIEQNYNCTITTEENANIRNALQLAAATGATDWSALQRWGFADNMLSSIRAGYLYPMSEFEGIINYKDAAKWGNPNVLMSFCYNDELYGLFPNYWPEFGFLSVDHLFVFNADLMNQAGVGDPRTMLEQGTWNRTSLQDLVRNATIETPEETIYGLGCLAYHFTDMSFHAAGNQFVIEKDGEYVDGLNTMRTIDTLTWSQKFLRDNADYIRLGADTYESEQAFVDGKCSMNLIHSYFIFAHGAKIAYGVENQGLLPFPLADDDTSGKWIGQYEEMQYSIHIPLTSSDPESTAYIVDALYEPFEGYETEEQLMDYYNRNVFHDARDTQLVMDMMNNLRYTFRYLTSTGSGLGPQTVIYEFAGSPETPKAHLDAYSSTFTSKDFPLIQEVMESAKAVFGE